MKICSLLWYWFHNHWSLLIEMVNKCLPLSSYLSTYSPSILIVFVLMNISFYGIAFINVHMKEGIIIEGGDKSRVKELILRVVGLNDFGIVLILDVW